MDADKSQDFNTEITEADRGHREDKEEQLYLPLFRALCGLCSLWSSVTSVFQFLSAFICVYLRPISGRDHRGHAAGAALVTAVAEKLEIGRASCRERVEI